MNYLATWKVLEELMIELRKNGASIPTNVFTDLKSARLMITISEDEECQKGDVAPKIEEYLGNVESYLISEAQKTPSSKSVDQWLRYLEEASAQVSVEQAHENKFVTGVPRDKKWVRVEPDETFSQARIQQLAKETQLSVKPQTDGRIVVYGQPESIKEFIKKMAMQTVKK